MNQHKKSVDICGPTCFPCPSPLKARFLAIYLCHFRRYWKSQTSQLLSGTQPAAQGAVPEHVDRCKGRHGPATNLGMCALSCSFISWLTLLGIKNGRKFGGDLGCDKTILEPADSIHDLGLTSPSLAAEVVFM